MPFWRRWQNATGERIFETNPFFYGMGNYGQMSLAHNTVTVWDPEEKIRGASTYLFNSEAILRGVFHEEGPISVSDLGDLLRGPPCCAAWASDG